MEIVHSGVEHVHAEAAVRQPPPPEIPEQSSSGVGSLQFMLILGVLMAVVGAVTLKRRQSQTQSEAQPPEL